TGASPERQPDPWSMFDRTLEYRAGPTETVAGIEQAIDLRSVPRPLLNLVEVAVVGVARAVGLFVEVNIVWLRIGHGPIIDPTEPLLRGFAGSFSQGWSRRFWREPRAAGPRRSRQLRLYQLGIGGCDPNLFGSGQGIAFPLVEEVDQRGIFSVQKVEAKAFV